LLSYEQDFPTYTTLKKIEGKKRGRKGEKEGDREGGRT